MLWILLLIAFALLFSFAYAAASGAPWVPTWKHDIDRLEKLLSLRGGELFVELGCGDGRVCLDVAKRTGATCVGVELSFAQWFVAQIRRIVSRAENVFFVLGDAFKHNLSNADVVYLFLMPDAYEKMRPKFERELKPGARVVSYVWPIPGWEPVKVDRESGKQALYLYVRGLGTRSS